MVNVRGRGELVRRFIVQHVEVHPRDIAKLASDTFGISRQAVNRHLQLLVEEGCLTSDGKTRSRSYALTPLESWHRSYAITDGLAEDRSWLQDVAPVLRNLPENVVHIWQYGFTEMFNNAIDHSEGSTITVSMEKTAASTTIHITDNGVGIFRKIQGALDLLDERQAPLELAKGKFTTDPRRHSGEGIFFTSRMFDEFAILSGSVYFSHQYGNASDWILEREMPKSGTAAVMKLNNHTARTTKKVFDQFSSGDDYGFNKTIVPVVLAKYGDDNLVSRSQAKRLLMRFERFRTVVLDFRGVDSLGQAFSDELFRVFPNLHPEVELVPLNANSSVKRMIERARSHDQPDL